MATNGGKTIEETYEKLSDTEHILKRPGMYIGDVKIQTHLTWTFNGTMLKDEVQYSSGFMKIFDEILTNALDHSMRDQTLTQIKVNYDQKTGIISIFNNGEGIPVVMHKTHGMYVPELIFGHLRSGSNYDDTATRIGAGTNGIGSNCTNIFSKMFEVETVDSTRHLKFEQVYEDNMTKASIPKITKTKVKGYTKITFIPDYSRFQMRGLDSNTIMMIDRRVHDCVMCTPARVKITLNDCEIKGKGITDYVKFFTDEKPIIETHVSDCYIWEWAVIPHHSFEQISFVNGNSTQSGGKHVDYILNQILTKLKTMIEQKKKVKDVKPSLIKDLMLFFLRATVKNPRFSSQTKETLITQSKDFGTKVEVSDKFIQKLYNTSIVDEIVSMHNLKQTSQLAKQTDGKKLNRIRVPKLEDALWAGTSKSEQCTLILTEGDSAKTYAVWGRSVTGNEKLGIFPLRGKLLNIRDATVDQLANNEEINNIKKIIGLKHGEIYKDTKSLRYSKVIMLADADVDGIHILGLFINFVHHFWPSLIKLNPSFIQTIKTPIIKAIKNKKTVEFFSQGHYDNWKSGNNTNGYTIRYFKGLGTSTKDDAKETFRKIESLRVDYYHDGPDCDKNILLAFDKDKNSKSVIKCSDLRKEWLSSYDKDSNILLEQNRISYSEFVNKQLIHFSVYDNMRSIPSICDGLKPSQRKILYHMLKRNITSSIKVAQLSGYISAEIGYHHGEASLQQAIINMAGDFIGTNNINLLFPDGNFGSRLTGSSDAASPRYIYTHLRDVSFSIFDKRDTPLLDFIQDDGMEVEPEWFIPVIPMILVNGCSGIGTGFSTFVPQYNPVDIIKNLMLMLEGKSPEDMFPYFKDFKGKVVMTSYGEYEIRGVFKKNKNTVNITEIPAGMWVTNYKEFLESALEKDSKFKLLDVKNLSKDENTDINFQIELQSDKSEESIYKNLKLIKKINTNNMYLSNRDKILKKYDTVLDILREYFPIRLEFYIKRRLHLIGKINEELQVNKNKLRFISMYIDGQIDINRKGKFEIETLLNAANFMKIDGEYKYLLSMHIISMSKERIVQLSDVCKKSELELEYYTVTDAKELWKIDLKELYTKLR